MNAMPTPCPAAVTGPIAFTPPRMLTAHQTPAAIFGIAVPGAPSSAKYASVAPIITAQNIDTM